MKFVALVSGGKDSFYSIMECLRNDHELLACAHLAPRRQSPEDGEEEESYMYQTAGSECIRTQVEDCLGVPLIIRECVGRSKNTSLVYDHDGDDDGNNNKDKDGSKKEGVVEDEVEDLYELLLTIRENFPTVQAISSGAILSTYQRTRIESVCSRLQLTSLGYMWRMTPQRNLLECMLKDGLDAVLVKVASPPGLMPRKHLNKTLGALFYGGIFDRLKDRFEFHICGEGGEYETLVLDCPIFKKRLVLDEVEVVDGDDGVGVLKVISCRAAEKERGSDWQSSSLKLYERIRELTDSSVDEIEGEDNALQNETPARTRAPIHLTMPSMTFLPSIQVLPGGLAHVSEMVSHYIPQKEHLSELISVDVGVDVDVDAELAVLEAKSIFACLDKGLKSIQWTDDVGSASGASAKDIVFVHLYLSNISHFAKINKHYSAFFGTVLPPSRSCVAVGENVLAGGRRVMMDCMIQRGSGTYMRLLPEANLNDPNSVRSSLDNGNWQFIKEHKENPHHVLRSTLHVQTVSHWAPVCVGPYSQANTLRSALIFMAGQIGLNAGTMALVDGGWRPQLSQSWRNAASVLDALEGSCNDILGGVVYVGSSVVLDGSSNVWQECERICRYSILKNGGIIAGRADEIKSSGESDELYGGFEDYETYKEVMGIHDGEDEQVEEEKDANATIPLLMVALPAMPVKAESEVELISVTSRASACLDMKTSSCSNDVCSNYAQDCTITTGCGINWDTGFDGINHDASNRTFINSKENAIAINSVTRSIGRGCAAICFTAASSVSVGQPSSINVLSVILDMIESAIYSIEESAGLGKFNILHVRLFYTCSAGDDGAAVRSGLNTAIASVLHSGSGRYKRCSIPAISLVPVKAMSLSPLPASLSNSTSFFIMQTMAMDLVHMETEMWIHHNR